MARPKKNNAEYFTHDADMRNDVKIKALRRKFSHTGYAVWNYLLETFTDSDFFEIEWTEMSIALLAADYDISVSELTEIVEYACRIGLLQMNDDKTVLFSIAHKHRFYQLLERRTKLSEAGKRGMAKRWASDNQPITPHNEVITSDSKAKETKEEETKGKDRYPYQDIADLWNSVCKSFPKISKLSDTRRAKIKARLNEFGKPESWMPTCEALFEEVEASSFLRGENKSNWQATFDWLFINGTNWIKVMEGNYANKGQQHKAGGIKLGPGEWIEQDGRRTYGTGRVTIPMNAPPRPGDKYAWDAATQKWIFL